MSGNNTGFNFKADSITRQNVRLNSGGQIQQIRTAGLAMVDQDQGLAFVNTDVRVVEAFPATLVD